MKKATNLRVGSLPAIWLVAVALVSLGATDAMGAKKTCIDCHPDAQAFASRKFVHDPIVKADCEVCHRRHGFSNTLVLKQDGSDLCYSCHDGLKQRLQKSTMHAPVSEGDCTA